MKQAQKKLHTDCLVVIFISIYKGIFFGVSSQVDTTSQLGILDTAYYDQGRSKQSGQSGFGWITFSHC